MDNNLPNEFDLVIVGTGINFVCTLFFTWNLKEYVLFTNY